MYKDRIEIQYQEHIAIVYFNRGEKRNALDEKMREAIVWAQQEIAKQNTVRAVILTANGQSFCTGLDKNSFIAQLQGESMALDLEKRTQGICNEFQRLAWQWRALPIPVIAAIHGEVFGGGLQIALAADMRYAATNTKISVMEVRWGLIADMSGSVLLRNICKEDVVKELCYTGRIVKAKEAQKLGLITQVVEYPLQHALSIARSIANSSPDAIRAYKRMLHKSIDATDAQALLTESIEQQKLIGSQNQIEAVKAVIEKRPPQFVVTD